MYSSNLQKNITMCNIHQLNEITCLIIVYSFSHRLIKSGLLKKRNLFEFPKRLENVIDLTLKML